MAEAAVVSDKIQCRICGIDTHAIQLHLKSDHPDWTLKRYGEEYPGAPVFSVSGQKAVDARMLQQSMAAAALSMVPKSTGVAVAGSGALHDVFGLGTVPAAMNTKGNPIPVTIFNGGAFPEMIPDIDSNYIFDIDLLKCVLMGVELNIPTFVWGHAGTGKTSLLEQIAARTRRAYMRVQHTLGMEERDVVGQWIVKGGETVFQLGPLAMAMVHGWMYIADEYDFALPGVSSLYQAVLEGKSLVIKDAPPEYRVIKPHRDFRILATGNTNGSGDETGLYQATIVGNAANYERFGIVVEMKYMAPELEKMVLVKQVGGISEKHAENIVKFANMVRESYAAGKISHTISPRTLIYACQLAIRRGSWRVGVTLAFSNRLARVDREVVEQLAQRIFDVQ